MSEVKKNNRTKCGFCFGYSLKKGALFGWAVKNKCDFDVVSSRLGMGVRKMLYMLENRKLFNEHQIRGLVYLVGAREAIEIIYFPSIYEKRRVWNETFGNSYGEDMLWR